MRGNEIENNWINLGSNGWFVQHYFVVCVSFFIFLINRRISNVKVSCETVRKRAFLEVVYSTWCRLSEFVKENVSGREWEKRKIASPLLHFYQLNCTLNDEITI
jgi:hypothetical protein